MMSFILIYSVSLQLGSLYASYRVDRGHLYCIRAADKTVDRYDRLKPMIYILLLMD
jgi:hypothetical protein